MSLDDRDYYREHIRKLQGFGPDPWNRAVVAPGMSEAEIDRLVIRRPNRARRCLFIAGLVGAALAGYLIAWGTA